MQETKPSGKVKCKFLRWSSVSKHELYSIENQVDRLNDRTFE